MSYPVLTESIVVEHGATHKLCQLREPGTGLLVASWVEKETNCIAQTTDTVYVTGFSSSITRSGLTGLFNPFGDIKQCTILRPNYQPSTLGLGSAYIQFSESSAATSSLIMDGRRLDGQTIKVSLKTADFNRNLKNTVTVCKQDRSKPLIWVGFSIGTRKRDLYHLFKTCGAVKRVTIFECNFEGLVEFVVEDSALDALKLDGRKLKGRVIRVDRNGFSCRCPV